MKIILAIAVIISALFLRFKYRPTGSHAIYIFGICLFTGVIMALSIGTVSSRIGLIYFLIEVVLCTLIVLSYRCEARRQAAVRERRQAAARRAARERAILEAQRKPLSCFAAFTETLSDAA